MGTEQSKQEAPGAPPLAVGGAIGGGGGGGGGGNGGSIVAGGAGAAGGGGAPGMAPIAEDGSLRDVQQPQPQPSLRAHPMSKTAQSTMQFRAASARYQSRPPPMRLDPTFALVGSSVPPNASNRLLHALCGRSWEVALARLRKRPRDASRAVKLEVYGMERRVTPLHLAVALGAPAEVVRALLEADEDGDVVRTGTANKVREEKGGSSGGGSGGSGGGKKRDNADAKRRSKSAADPSPQLPGTGTQGGQWDGVSKAPRLAASSGRPQPRSAAARGAVASRATSTKSVSSVVSASSAATAPHSNLSPTPALDLAEVAGSDGWTALHLACLYQSDPHVMELLLDHELGWRGSAKVKSGLGLLPLHVAASGMACDRLRWSEDAAAAGDGTDRTAPLSRSLPGAPTSSDQSVQSAWWGPGDLVRAVSLLLAAFPGAVHVPCSRPLRGNGWARPGEGEPTITVGAGGVADNAVQLTPVQYARRYLPENDETREVLDLLEGRKKVDPGQFHGGGGGSVVMVSSAGGMSDSFGSLGTDGGTSSSSPKQQGGKKSQRRGSKTKKNKRGGHGGNVQSLRTGEAASATSKRRSSHPRSLLKSVAAAMHLLPSSHRGGGGHHGKMRSAGGDSAVAAAGGLDDAPTRLYTLLLAHDWTGARDRLAHHPEEAAVWTLVDSSEDAAGGGEGGGGGGGPPAGGPTMPKIKKGSYRSGGDEEPETAYGCHRLPLHRACASKPPAELVRALVEAYPDGIRSREKFAMLPLHVACQWGASSSVISALIDLHPPASRERDAFGLLPLHLACTEGSSPDVLSALLRSYPGSVDERDNSGRRPEDYVRESLHPNRGVALRELGRDPNYWFATRVSSSSSSSPSKEARDGGGSDSGGATGVAGAGASKGGGRGVPALYLSIARKRWDEALGLLSSDPAQARAWVIDDAYTGAGSDAASTGGSAASKSTSTTPRRPRLPLHAACRRRAPPEVVRALLAAHPGGAAERGGRLDLLPLHMACQHGSDAASVEELVRAYPEGTETADNFGLLPIHLAVTEGASPAIVQTLLRRHPHGARAKDRRGNTPLAYARASFHPHKDEVLELLGRDPESWPSSSPSPPPTKAAPPPSPTKAAPPPSPTKAAPPPSPTKAAPPPSPTKAAAPPSPTKAAPPSSPSSSSRRADDDEGGWTLSRLVDRGDWDGVVGRAAERPGEAAAPRDLGDGEGGLLPLHRACRAGAAGAGGAGGNRAPAPRRAVEALLRAYPAGAKTSSEKGDLPLHLACKHRASLDTVQLLLEAFPLGASARDERGRLPLHVACVSGTTPGVLEALLGASPGTAEMTDGRGRTPLDYVEESFHRNKNELIDVLWRYRREESSALRSATRLYDLVAQRRWGEVAVRAREVPSEAAVWSIGGGGGGGLDGRLPLHLACSLNAPRRAVAVLVNAHPDGVRTTGNDGRTCLHEACGGGASADVVQLLINAHPDAVSLRDRSGSLPIHVACREGAGIEAIKLLLRASPELFAAVEDERGWTVKECLERSHPDYEMVLARLPRAPPARNNLREGLVPMRSVPARLGVEEGKKRVGSPSAKKCKEIAKPSSLLQRSKTMQPRTEAQLEGNGGAFVQMQSLAVSRSQSSRSLGNEDDRDESHLMRKSMFQIPVISV